jgi:hypothetical protein
MESYLEDESHEREGRETPQTKRPGREASRIPFTW